MRRSTHAFSLHAPLERANLLASGQILVDDGSNTPRWRREDRSDCAGANDGCGRYPAANRASQILYQSPTFERHVGHGFDNAKASDPELP